METFLNIWASLILTPMAAFALCFMLELHSDMNRWTLVGLSAFALVIVMAAVWS